MNEEGASKMDKETEERCERLSRIVKEAELRKELERDVFEFFFGKS